LPYLFTALVDSHYIGGPVLRHPSVAFPTDAATYKEMYSFMFGSAIYVLPVVAPNVSSATGYLPKGLWYNLWALTGALNANSADPIVSGPQPTWSPKSPLYVGDIPAYVKAGSVLPFHPQPLNTVAATRISGVSLLCALDSDGNAAGHAAFDDGAEGPLPAAQSNAYYMDFRCSVGPTFAAISSQLRTPNATYAPLTPTAASSASVVVWFPAIVSLASLTAATINNQPIPASAWKSDTDLGFTRLTVVLPEGYDATTAFTLVLGTQLGAPSAPTDDGWFSSTHDRVFVVGGALALLIFLGATFAARRQSRAARRQVPHTAADEEILNCN
jgi:hypothetical protein